MWKSVHRRVPHVQRGQRARRDRRDADDGEELRVLRRSLRFLPQRAPRPRGRGWSHPDRAALDDVRRLGRHVPRAGRVPALRRSSIPSRSSRLSRPAAAWLQVVSSQQEAVLGRRTARRWATSASARSTWRRVTGACASTCAASLPEASAAASRGRSRVLTSLYREIGRTKRDKAAPKVEEKLPATAVDCRQGRHRRLGRQVPQGGRGQGRLPG